MDAQIRNARSPIEKLIAVARSGASWQTYPGLLSQKVNGNTGKFILPLSDNLSLWIYIYQYKNKGITESTNYSLSIFGTRVSHPESILEQRHTEASAFYGTDISLSRGLIATWHEKHCWSETPSNTLGHRTTQPNIQSCINWAIFTYVGCDAYDVCYLGSTGVKAKRPQWTNL